MDPSAPDYCHTGGKAKRNPGNDRGQVPVGWGTLRQESSSAQRTLKRSWSIDDQAHLVLTQHIESISLMTKDARAVFDRQ